MFILVFGMGCPTKNACLKQTNEKRKRKKKKKKERKEMKACGVALNFAQTVLAQF